MLEWAGELRFAAHSGSQHFTLDGRGTAGPSPVQALVSALAGCMSADVVDILTKGRLPLRAMRARLHAERRAEDPRRLVAARLHFVIGGEVPSDRVDRAIALSRERYCSVLHSLRQDLDFQTSFEIEP